MADASVSIGGDASGAIAACAAAQGAIDALHGKTVNIDINTRGGGAGGMGEATRGMQDFGTAADRASRSTRGMGDNLGRSSGHVGRMANDAEKLRNHLAAVDNVLRNGPIGGGSAQSSGGMRQLANDADRARSSIGQLGSGSRGMREIESSAQRASRAVSEIGGGSAMRAIESGTSAASRGFRDLGDGAQSASRFIVDAGGGAERVARGFEGASRSASRFAADASGGVQQVSRDLVPMAQGADGAYRSVAKLGGASKELEKFAGGSGRSITSGPNLLGLGGDVMGSLASDLGKLPAAAAPAMAAIKGIGIAGGVSAIGMGALTAAVAGVGLAGVAEDFAHNTQLMHGGEQAIRGFNKAFTAMRSETSAAGMPEMAGLKGSLAGVGHELAKIGAQNIAPVMQDATAFGNSTTAAMKKLEPAIGPAEQAMTSLGGAVVGALGASGPQIASFANSVTQNSAGIQAGLTSTVSLMSNLGSMTAQALGTAAPLIQGASDVAGGLADVVSGASGLPSNNTAPPNPDGSRPGGVSTANRFGGALGGAATGGLYGAALGAAVGSAVPILGTAAGAVVGGTVGAVSGAVGGYMDAPGKADQAQKLGPLDYHPQSYYTGGRSGSGGQGDFGPGSGGPALPAGGSSSAASDALTQSRAAAGLPPVGQPHWSGVGPRGPGQSVGAMPASIGGGLGVGGIAPLNNMMQAAGAQVAGGGAQTGQAVAQHIQKAVNVAAPAAAAGGAAIGAGMNSGMAQGSTSTQSVVDTLIIKHSKHIVDLASAALGVHSPSTEFDYLGRMTMLGFGQGQEREAAATFGSMTDSVSGMLSGQQDMASKYSPDYQGTNGPSVSVSKPKQAMDYASSLANANIEKHNKRATDLAAGREELQRQAIGGMTHDERRDQLLQNRAGNHERALANLGVSGHPKQSGDVNPFAADQANAANRRAGVAAVINPFHALGLKAAGAEHGQALAQGVTVGLGKGTPGAQAGVAQFGRAVQTQHKKTHGIASPSTVFASDGMNLAAGAASGVTAGTPMAVASVNSMSEQMQTAGQWLSDKGLMVGYAYAQNIVTGVSQEIKKADYQALGLPKLNQAAELALAATGLLSAGSGAESYKTPGNAPGLVVLPAASSGGGMATVNVEAHFHLDDQITTISKQAMVDVLSDAAHTISLQQGS